MNIGRERSISPGDGAGVITERRGALARIRLDRPRQRNALNGAARREIMAALGSWARDPEIYAVTISSTTPGVFCAGGDVREMSDLVKADRSAATAAFAEELALIWQVECFPKPIVALIDGPVMGTGAGLSQFATHRVAGAGYRLAMPETAIGFYPDVAMMHAFARAPAGLGRWMALTGQPIGRGAAFRAGFATHLIDADQFDAIEAALIEAEPVDPLLDGRHALTAGERDPSASDHLAARHFAGNSALSKLLDDLETAAGTDPHAAETRRLLATRCPMSLAVTDRFLALAANLDIRGALVHDYRIGSRLLARPDFCEGVRAVLIDKDGKPRWKPPQLSDVSASEVEACFSAVPEGDLTLLPAREMARLR